MSTKIYEAYRMKIDTLENVFIPAYRNHCLDVGIFDITMRIFPNDDKHVIAGMLR